MIAAKIHEVVSYTPIDVGSDSFYEAIQSAKAAGKETEKVKGVFGTIQSKWFGSFVHTYNEDEYRRMVTVLFDEGKAGFALKNRDIISIFKHPDCKLKALDYIIPEALNRGGKRLDCFNRGLPEMYAKYGFTPVAKVAFTEEFAPEDWNYARDDHPDVVFMVYKKTVIRGSPEHPQARIQRIQGEIGLLPYSTYEDAVSIQTQAVEALEQYDV